MKKKQSLPTRYWIYVLISILLFILLFISIFITVAATSGKELHEFSQRDGQIFAVYLISSAATVAVGFYFAFKAQKIHIMCAKTHYASYQYQGIDPNDYEAVWFDSSNSERALISKAGDVYILEVQELNEKEERWASVEVVHSIQSIDEIKKLLFYDFDFFCAENSVIDKWGNEDFMNR